MIEKSNIDEFVDRLKATIRQAEQEAYEDCNRYEAEYRERATNRRRRLYDELRAPRTQLEQIFKLQAAVKAMEPVVLEVLNKS